MTPPRIVLDAAAFGWGGRLAVGPVSGVLEPGSMTAVVGPNGAGKSTLLKGIMGVLRPLSGRVRFEGGGRRDLAWLPQGSELDRSFPITVADMVAMGAWRRVGSWRAFGRRETARIDAVLAEVGLQDQAGLRLAELSGGQLQRALYARMLLQDAPVLLLDEPFAAVDPSTVQTLMASLRRLHARGCTIVAVLHDLALVRREFPQALALAGQVAGWGEAADVLAVGEAAA
ncbi:metal ABC transporter ATP-binding protein [Bordetella sp. 2513F-2]